MSLVALFALVWNPVMHACRCCRASVLRPRELLFAAAQWFLVIGLTAAVGPSAKMLMMEDTLLSKSAGSKMPPASAADGPNTTSIQVPIPTR